MFEIAYGYVMLGTLPYRTGIARPWFWLQMFVAVFMSIWGNTFLATKPGAMADTTSAIIRIVPTVCLLLITVNTAMFLSAAEPRRHSLDPDETPALQSTSEETDSVEA
ncbi:hypothetical protein [Nocardia sp. NBC_01388]|uniref:hypothetical protein n=1 Tax=Nocardia sp. NBC_01388 TaxID=2903596 RepID=UPI003256987B